MGRLESVLILSLLVTLLITIQCLSFLICSMGENNTCSIFQGFVVKALCK